MLVILAALAPVLAIIIYIYARDKYEKEPIKLLILAFFLGAASVFLPLIWEPMGPKLGFSDQGDVWSVTGYAFLFVGLSEELGKYLMLLLFIYPRKDFNEPYDGIIYALMVSMGFAALENIMYVMEGGMSTAISRAFTAVPAHAAFGILMGYFVGQARFNKKKKVWFLFLGLLVPIIFHGLYDVFLFLNIGEGIWVLSIITLGLGIVLSFRAIKINQTLSPFKKKSRWKFKDDDKFFRADS